VLHPIDKLGAIHLVGKLRFGKIALLVVEQPRPRRVVMIQVLPPSGVGVAASPLLDASAG
jgi:hypothetical protein